MITATESFPLEDTVGAWVPHGRFVLPPTASGPLDGLRFAAKDLFDVAGHPTGAGNPTWLATHPATSAHAPVVAHLLGAGATLMGKVLTDELAYSLHGDNMHYGSPLNSAAAVAARLVDFALGTDTGGSTRVPASYCGLWGLRTTHGLVSTQGLVPLHPSFDTVTWLAWDANTFERVGGVLLPPNPTEFTTLLTPPEAWALADPVFERPLHRAREALTSLLSTPANVTPWLGAETLADWRQTYATAGAHEGWRVHGDWISRHAPRFSPAIAARWAHASQVSNADAEAARAEVARIRQHVRALIGAKGIALLPSAASLAPRRDADPATVDAVRLRTMAITCIAGLAGLPQVSLPLQSDEGVPLGVSLIGPAGSDQALIGLARRLHSLMV
ncbi:MAG: amidase [Burkholderiaceae bacterium]